EREHTPLLARRLLDLPVVRDLDRAARCERHRRLDRVAEVHDLAAEVDVQRLQALRCSGQQILAGVAGLDLLALRAGAAVDARSERDGDEEDALHTIRSDASWNRDWLACWRDFASFSTIASTLG